MIIAALKYYYNREIFGEVVAGTASRRGVVVDALAVLAEAAEVAIVSCPFVRGRWRRCACVRAGRHRGAERRTSRVRQV